MHHPAKFDPSRLTQIRNLRSLSKKDLADLVSLSPSSITQFENGISRPTAESIKSLSKALDVEESYFDIGRPYFKVSNSGIHFRSLRSTPARDRKKAEAHTELLRELINLLELELDFPEPNLDGLETEGLSPEEAANELRKFWRIPSGPIQNFVNILELNGVFISIANFAGMDKIGAFSTNLENKPIIIINKERTSNVYVQRFTLAHELGHLLIHKEAIPGDKTQEKEADRFAAEFLMPKSSMLNDLPRRYSLPKLIYLSQKWGVSIEALLYRSKELGIISDQSARRGFINIKSSQKNGDLLYPNSEKYIGESPRMLSKAISIMDDNFMAHASDYLNLSPNIIRQLIGYTDKKPKLRLVI